MSISIRKKGAYALIYGALNSKVYQLSRELPGFRKWVNGELVLEISSSNLEFVFNNLPEIIPDEEIKKEYENILLLRKQEQETKKNKLIELEAPDFPFKKVPFKHQLNAFQISKDLEAFGYFLEMGCGKTKITIDVFSHLFLEGKIDQVLIIAPKGVHRQWVNEQLPEHLPDCIKSLKVCYQAGNKKSNSKILSPSGKDVLKILSMNVETFSHSSGGEFAEEFVSKGRTFIVVDESSRIKNYSASRTKSILKLAKKCKYRRILSGTPVTKGVEDLYTQLSFLDPNILGFNSYYTFRNRYCRMGGFESKQIVGYKNLEELTSKLDGHTLRITKDECLDLPEKIFTSRYVEWLDQQKEIYDKLKKDFIVEMEGGTLSAALAVVRIMRLQQILCGRVQTSEGMKDIPSLRASVLMEVLEENRENKTIVWCRFTEDIKFLSEVFKEYGIKHVTYFGETSDKDRTEAIRSFQEDEDTRIFLGNPQAAGIGLNLTAASVVVWYSLSFDLEQYLQANDRCHRIGQNKPVLYVHLETPGSIDVKISKALKSKKSLADNILDIRELLDDLPE